MQLEPVSLPVSAQPGFRTLTGQAALAFLVVDRMCYRDKKAASTEAHMGFWSRDHGNLLSFLLRLPGGFWRVNPCLLITYLSHHVASCFVIYMDASLNRLQAMWPKNRVLCALCLLDKWFLCTGDEYIRKNNSKWGILIMALGFWGISLSWGNDWCSRMV